MIEKVSQLIEELYPQLIELRRTLHEYPELSNEEYRTVELIKAHLQQANIKYEALKKMNAIVGLINGVNQGKVVALRADMDALPIQEANQTEYASKVSGVMHACGHDVHTTILVGAGLILNQLRHEFNGTIKLLFQPAEETDGGANRMIQAGVLTNPDVDFALGLHCHPDFEVGNISLCLDKAHAASDMLTIRVYGKKAHGAYPDEGIDAILVASHLITALQALISRNTSPFNPVVLSFGTINGGDAGNVIASDVMITGILRTFDEHTRQFMLRRLNEVCEHIGAAYEATIKIQVKSGYPALINDECLVEIFKNVAVKVLGTEHVSMQAHGSLGVEDFAYFALEVPSCFYNLGTTNVEKGIIAGLHSDQFDVDEEAIKVGVKLQVLATLELLGVTL